MSVAPELPPVVHIPARARRHSTGRIFVAPGVPALPTALLVANPPVELEATPALLVPTRLRLVLAPHLEPVCEFPLVDLAPRPAPAVRPASRPLRLTVRGWAVLGALAVAVMAVLLVIAHASAPGSAGRSSSPAPAVVTVHDGDTLWSIASRIARGRDPRAVVDQLERVNHLSGANLAPGQVLHTQ
jgi:hypothetical protein